MHTHTYVHAYTNMHIYMHICICAPQEIRQDHFNEKVLGGCKELAALSQAERRQVCKLMSKVMSPLLQPP